MIKLNYYGTIDNGTNGGINIKTLPSQIATKEIIDSVFGGKKSMTDWVLLPTLVENKSYINDIISYANYVQKKYDNFVVLGIGGSALGAKSVMHAFRYKKRTSKVNCIVLDNIEPDYFLGELRKLNLKKTIFNVVSKSGKTTETLFQLDVVAKMLKDKKLALKNHLVITSETDNELYSFAQQNDIKTFIVPKGVGGRYSVLSPVGLLPISVFGLDIVKLLSGAKSILDLAKNEKLNANLALTMAAINYYAYKRGKDQIVFMPYSEQLSLLVDYFNQLYAESLGKTVESQGKKVGVGQTPIKAVGVTDQHSLLQLFNEGQNNKLFMFLGIEKTQNDFVNNNVLLPNANNFMGVGLKQLLDIEQVATSYSLTKNGRLNYTLTIDELNENSMGELLYLLQVVTAFMGELLQVNAYDQPGVEQSKIYIKALLNSSTYKTYKKEIESFVDKSKKFVL